MLFNEVPLLDRFRLARRCGFRAVEVQGPYEAAKEDLADRLCREGLTPALLNLPVSFAAVPGRETEFRTGLGRALEYARATGCRQLHCLAGQTEAAGAEKTLVANLRWASRRARSLDVRLLLEPLNTYDNPGYFLTGSTQARRLIEDIGETNILLQYDFYHMQIMEGRLAETVRAHFEVIGHFQVGGVPGRHEPDGRQEINYPYLFELIDDLGYTGWIGCEYRPRAGSVQGLGWARPYGIAEGSPDEMRR